MSDVQYVVEGRVARITLNRPARGNGINRRLLSELEQVVESADLDPAVSVLLLSGNGKGFCGGYDLVQSAEGQGRLEAEADAAVGLSAPAGSPLDPEVMSANHDPSGVWDPTVDYAMMSRNVRAFMSLFHCGKPVVCKVHGFCVAGGTDMALCSDLLVIAEDARIGYPPARVWGSPTTSMWAYRLGAQRAKRLLFTGDSLSGAEAVEWGLAIEAPAAADLDERTEALVARIARVPVNQLRMMKLLVNQSMYAQGLHATQVLGTVFDGVARHTAEGFAFQGLAAGEGFRAAVRQRDEPFGDLGPSTFKG
jgi:enoyl-CoA hydratase/carnithine racemase